MLGQLPQRERLGVRRPGQPVVGHALEQLARGGHFVIELGEEHIDERPWGWMIVSFGSGSRLLVVSREARHAGGLPKFTLGTCSAAVGALNSGCSLKPKMLAVTFDGKRRRSVLYSCTRSL